MDRKEIGFRVLRWRRDAGWTQGELARLAGVSRNRVNRLECGLHVPDTTTLNAVATALGKPLTELLGIETSPAA